MARKMKSMDGNNAAAHVSYAVSYTHLLHPGKGRLVLGALAGALSALLVLLPVSRLIPVSYTHLDVYKRQDVLEAEL